MNKVNSCQHSTRGSIGTTASGLEAALENTGQRKLRGEQNQLTAAGTALTLVLRQYLKILVKEG